MSILKEIKRLFGVKGASIEEALKNVDSIGGGESGGGVFIAMADFGETATTLDKTWQEIHDAISSGKIGVVRTALIMPETPTTYSDILISSIFYSIQGGVYEVMTFENDGTQIVYKTTTADGYPSFSESEPGGGTEPA